MMTNSIYQHFKKEEIKFIDKILEYKMRVEDTYVPILTHFLTPREQFIAQSLFNKQDNVHLFFFGGHKNAERKKALITIADQYSIEDFDIDILDIHYPKKFATLKHNQILGTLLSTGLKREVIGDIITDNNRWQIILTSTIVPYIKEQVYKIANISIHFERITFENVLTSNSSYQIIEEVVSSLRLDTIISKIFHLSRDTSKALLEKGLVNLNFVPETRTTIELAEKDILSVRKYGRIKLDCIQGQTKNNKLKIVVHVTKK